MGKQIPKMSARVVNAIRSLREVHGSTSKEIMNYIMAQHDGSESSIQRQMHTALKRGLDYGILKKSNGHYSLNTEADLGQVAPVLSPVERRGRRRRRRSRRRGRGKRRRSRGRRRRSRRRRSGRRRRRSRSRRRPLNASEVSESGGSQARKARDAHRLRNSPVEFPDPEPRMSDTRNDDQPNEERRSRSRRRSHSRSRTRSRSRAKSLRDSREE